MIQVKVTRNEEGLISSFKIEGHSGYAERGQDIVCAAVSALSQTTLMGLEEVLGLSPAVIRYEGMLEVAVREPRLAAALLDAMLLGLRDVARSYPEYIRVLDEGPDPGQGGETHD